MTPNLLTLTEAAARVGIHPESLRYHIEQGRLIRADGGNRGHRAVYRPEDVDALAASLSTWRAGRKADPRPLAEATGDLLTRWQSAELLGVTPDTFKHYTLKGLIHRANEGGQRVTAYYRRCEVEALRPHVRGEARRAMYAAWEAAGERPCKRCGQILTFDRFYKNGTGAGPAGREANCIECVRAIHQEERAAHPERYRRQYRRWAQRNKPYLASKAARYRERNRPRVLARHRAWWAANGRAFRGRNNAILDGKCSPVCRREGFSLVRDSRGEWRAARLDKPIGAGEVALARYEWSYTNRLWIVSVPSVVPAMYRAEAEDLVRRLTIKEKGKSGAGMQKAVAA